MYQLQARLFILSLVEKRDEGLRDEVNCVVCGCCTDHGNVKAFPNFARRKSVLCCIRINYEITLLNKFIKSNNLSQLHIIYLIDYIYKMYLIYKLMNYSCMDI